MYVCIFVCHGMHACMFVRTYACMYVCMYPCTYICMYARQHVCVFGCMNVCILAWLWCRITSSTCFWVLAPPQEALRALQCWHAYCDHPTRKGVCQNEWKAAPITYRSHSPTGHTHLFPIVWSGQISSISCTCTIIFRTRSVIIPQKKGCVRMSKRQQLLPR